MTADEIFKVMLENPILTAKYGLTEEQLSQMSLSIPTEYEIIEAIKLVVIGIENETPETTVNSQIRSLFKI